MTARTSPRLPGDVITCFTLPAVHMLPPGSTVTALNSSLALEYPPYTASQAAVSAAQARLVTIRARTRKKDKAFRSTSSRSPAAPV